MDTRVDSNSYLTEEQKRVYQLRASLERNGGTPVGFLELLAAVVNEGTWQQIPSGLNREEPFTSFADFVEAKPPFGLDSSVEHVQALLRLRHPHEGVPHIREQMDQMRSRVHQLLGPAPEDDPIDRDAHTFGVFAEHGGWMFALLVARSARKGGPGPRLAESGAESDEPSAEPSVAVTGLAAEESLSGEADKVSFKTFARRARCDVKRVSRYHRAWERAAQAGIVPPAAQLSPGQDVLLPPPESWATYFTTYEPGNDRHEQLAAEADAIGTSFKKAVEITTNRPAMRAAILGDPRTAQAAQEALLERPEARAALVAEALADPAVRKQATAQARTAERIEYLQRVLADGKAKTPGGRLIELESAAQQTIAQRLAAIRDPHSSAEEVAQAYEYVQDVVAHTVQADPDLLLQEQRTKLGKTLHSTVKSIESIDPDDLLAFADDALITSITALQERVNALAALIIKLSSPAS